MITRTTNATMARSAQANLQANISRLAKLQEQATTSAAITRPSDNPTGTADAMKVRAEIRANAQYKANISEAGGWLMTVDQALANTTDILRRVKDLAVSAGGAALSPADRGAIATEIEGLKQDLLGQANTAYLGRTVFAGNSDAGHAFTADSYAYTGATDAGKHGPVERRIDVHTSVRVDVDGTTVFGEGDSSVFKLLDDLAADLRGNGTGSALSADLDARINTVLTVHTEVGVRHARTLTAEEQNMEQAVALETRRSGIEDLDTAKVIMDLKLQEVAYQSALAVTARVLQPTLMDFLR